MEPIAGRIGLYAVRDLVAQQLSGPVQSHVHDAVAVRVFTDLLGDAQTSLSSHPGDYELLFLGSVGLVSGDISVPEVPQVVITGAAWMAMQKPAAVA